MNSRYSTIARALASAFLTESMEPEAMVRQAGLLFGRRWRFLPPLARRISAALAGGPRPRHRVLTWMLMADEGFARAYMKHSLRLTDPLVPVPAMAPVDAARGWSVTPIHSAGELADWLGVTHGQLGWFADMRRTTAVTAGGKLGHYHYRTLARRFGQVRLIEAPKPRLKALQRQILRGILDAVPVHGAAHGFQPGRSIKSFADPHVGRAVVLRMDLRDFFPSIPAARISALFRTIGYPESVADLLTGLTTHSTPCDAWDREAMAGSDPSARPPIALYQRPHLPQGAPTSPALANRVAYRLDCRLAGLAAATGAVYTRYADDLVFSGDREFARVVSRVQHHVAAIVLEEGFAAHYRKTRIMRQGVRQRIAGIVVNQRLNVARSDYDRLKAILTNCIRHGPASQNRDGHLDFRAHLLGRISFVANLNPDRGRRLEDLFGRIGWD